MQGPYPHAHCIAYEIHCMGEDGAYSVEVRTTFVTYSSRQEK
jgi:hypothetical protein